MNLPILVCVHSQLCNEQTKSGRIQILIEDTLNNRQQLVVSFSLHKTNFASGNSLKLANRKKN